jgi:periplasmic glucans biosynthesis protein
MFVSGGSALAAAAALNPGAARADLIYGPPVKFSWDALQAWAEAIARAPYAPASPSNREIIQRLDYDTYQQIRFRADSAITLGKYPVELFHVGKYFMEPVRIFVVEGGVSRGVLYNPDLFSYGDAGFAKVLPDTTGFAGFRVMRGTGVPDWIAFLGASYFRTTGETMQYGLSTRGLALNIGLPEPEEFPRFTNFWLEKLDGADGVMIYALLDSPSVAGAYRIRAIREHGAITEISMVLHARQDVHRLGVAPLTSMYWYGKLNRDHALDWRPEIHDSDGLAMWTSEGEHIWRPLNNPPITKLSSFIDKSPKGFGLMQRERNFEAYEDDGVFYNRRPSVWVEPIGDWGPGAVQLLEIPTDDETLDNIVAFWNPKKAFNAGDRVALSYRIHWRNDAPFPPANGRVVATRRGEGGRPGQPRRAGVTKYVIDFEGGELGQLENKDGVKLNLSVSRGQYDLVSAYRVVGTPRWRAMFDFIPDGQDAADIRAYLEQNGRALTETWIYQHVDAPRRG